MIKKNTIKILYLFLFAHLILWTLVPTFSNKNLPLDVIEALAWGTDLSWGWDKHPPLSVFFPEVFYQIFGNQDWAYYLYMASSGSVAGFSQDVGEDADIFLSPQYRY